MSRGLYGAAVFAEVDDPAVLADIDRPEDLGRLLRTLGQERALSRVRLSGEERAA